MSTLKVRHTLRGAVQNLHLQNTQDITAAKRVCTRPCLTPLGCVFAMLKERLLAGASGQTQLGIPRPYARPAPEDHPATVKHTPTHDEMVHEFFHPAKSQNIEVVRGIEGLIFHTLLLRK